MAAVQTHPLLSDHDKSFYRKASFNDVEEYCLRKILLDESDSSTAEPQHTPQPTPTTETSKTLDDKVLFQVPFVKSDVTRSNNPFGRHEKQLIGLWQAFEDGAHNMIMHNRTPSTTTPGKVSNRKASRIYSRNGTTCSDASSRSSYLSGNYMTIESDVRVFAPHQPDEDSSWGEEEGGFLHYNAWEVMRDEYAEDFGYNYNETEHTIAAALSGEADESRKSHVFRIIGTSADDQSAQPHVLSPPLMDSLLNFVPESLSMENYWMKFSLVRDGASLFTMKNYLKATPYSLLAIETTKGEVFGAFTSSTWRNNPTYFGSMPAFLWRMKNNRRTPCYSLFDQAQMESEIETYPFSGYNDLVQVCDEGRLAIGGGKLVPDWQWLAGDDDPEVGTIHGGIKFDSLDHGQSYGFGIYLDDDLLEGTTSPCGTFRNPCLVDAQSKGEVFQVANLEVWTFTPCMDVKAAEKMELTRYCLEQSTRSSVSTNSTTRDVFSASNYTSEEHFQRDFYRRVGQSDPAGGHRRKNSYEYNHVHSPIAGRWKF